MTEDGDTCFDVETYSDLADCCASGDCEDACRYILANYSVDWRVVKKCEDGNFHNVTATSYDKRKVCEAIYFESESDFSDEQLAEVYLIWQAASQLNND